MGSSPYNSPSQSRMRGWVSDRLSALRESRVGQMTGNVVNGVGEAAGIAGDGLRATASIATGPIRYVKVKDAEATLRYHADSLPHDGAEYTQKFNRSLDHLGFQRGDLGASAKGAYYRVASLFGADTSKWGSTELKGGSSFREVADKAIAEKPGIIERIVSKPFRLMGGSKGGAIVGLGAIAAAGTYGVVRATHHHQNQVTPEEAMMLEMRMRQGGMNGGFAASEQARREAAMQASANQSNASV